MTCYTVTVMVGPFRKDFAMAYPITYYPEEVEGFPNSQPSPPSWVKSRTRAKQAYPFNLTLPYTHISRRFVSLSQVGYPQAYTCDVYYPSDGGHHAISFGLWSDGMTMHIDTLARLETLLSARLVARLGDPASLGITLVQYRQAATMLNNRLISIALVARDLRRLNFASAVDRLVHANGSPDVRKRLRSTERKLKRSAKDFANNFLELHFGWVPLATDAYTSMEVLSSPIPYGKLRVTAKVNLEGTLGPSNLNFWETMTSEHKAKYRGVAGCEILVTNPNLYLLNQLGLLNPAEVVWDAIPWSFVVGWFWNVNQFLGQFSNYAGCTTSRAYWNALVTSESTKSRTNRYPGYSGTSIVRTAAKSFRRFNSLPQVTFMARPVKLPSVTRGLTAASLLAQFLKG